MFFFNCDGLVGAAVGLGSIALLYLSGSVRLRFGLRRCFFIVRLALASVGVVDDARVDDHLQRHPLRMRLFCSVRCCVALLVVFFYSCVEIHFVLLCNAAGFLPETEIDEHPLVWDLCRYYVSPTACVGVLRAVAAVADCHVQRSYYHWPVVDSQQRIWYGQGTNVPCSLFVVCVFVGNNNSSMTEQLFAFLCVVIGMFLQAIQVRWLHCIGFTVVVIVDVLMFWCADVDVDVWLCCV